MTETYPEQLERVRRMATEHVAPFSRLSSKDAAALRAVLERLEAAEQDGARLDWLESEGEREKQAWAAGKMTPYSLFRRNEPITRAAIDAARGGK